MQSCAPKSGDNQNLRHLVDAAAEALVVVDEQGIVRFANRAARQLFDRHTIRVGSPAPFPLGTKEVAEFTVHRASNSPLTLEKRPAPITWDHREATLFTLRNLSALRSAEANLVNINRLFAALAHASSICAGADSADDLFNELCHVCVAHGGFRLASIVRPNAASDEIEFVAAAGPAAGYLETLRVRLQPGHPESQGPIAQTLRLGLQYVCNDFAADPSTRPWRESAANHGLNSCSVTPIETGEQTHIALLVHADQTDYFTGDLQTLLRQIAAEVASGLERIADRAARREMERALIESEARFRQMAEVNHQVFWMRDADTDALLYVSPAHERVFGTPAKTAYANPRSWIDAVHPDDRAKVQALHAMRGREGVPAVKYRIVRPDGSHRWVREEAYPILEGDRVVRITGTLTDITEEHRARQELLQRENSLQQQATLLDAANDAILLISLDGTVLYWNRGAQRLLGWSREEAVGKKAASLFFPDEKELKKRRLSLSETGTWQGNLEFVAKSGATVCVDSGWTLVGDESGKPRSVLLINTDITERKRIEANLLRAQRLESIGTLASGIAHDLNNILAPIMLSADVLYERLGETKEAEFIEMISSSAKRGSDVVRQVLSFARGLDSTRMPVNFRHLFSDLEKIIRETFPRSLTFESRASRDLAAVVADPTQLHQVLLNLCVNARDSMPEGGSLSLEVENIEIDAMFASQNEGARPGPHVRVRVRDTGSGISESDRKRIFEPFFTTKPSGQGTGLGLATVLEIVRNHGGFLCVESEMGRGTEFALYFPSEGQSDDVPVGIDEAPGPRGQGELILIVDDEKSVCEITSQSLESCGYRTICAAHGAEGISRFVEHRNDVALVVTDVMMPVMDGVTAIRTLRHISPHLPIIVMSGVAAPPNLDGAGRFEKPCQFLLKPFSLDHLLKSVRETLDNAREPERAAGGG